MSVYSFGAFQLDSARRELLRDGVPVAVAPKAFDLIVYLLEHRERAVGRDELISGVWGRVDVSDNVLDQSVLKARKALDDLAEPRHSIATRPRFGFAWVAPVQVVGPATAAASAPPPDAVPTQPDAVPQGAFVAPPPETSGRAAATAERISRGASGRSARTIAAVLLLALLAIAAWWLTRSDDPHDNATAGATLVLPFQVAADANAEWARLGLMDLVADRLREAGVDTVPSDNAVALVRGIDAVPGDDAGLLALARRAGALRAVHGNVAFVGGQWQVGLRMRGPDHSPVDAEGAATQPLDAARAAADQLALALGHRPAGVALPGDSTLALRLQQIDAAVLGDDLEAAQRLFDALPPEQRSEPAVRMRGATLRFRRGELDAAADAFTALLADVPASDEPHLAGSVLSALGNLALRRGDPAGAEARGDEAIAVLAMLPASPELGRAYTGRAIARSTQGRFAPALEDFAQARVVLDGVGDRLGTARVDLNVGILDARRDRFAEAEPVLASASDRLAAFNDLTNELFARVALAQVRLGLLDPAAALAGDARLAELVAREPNAERQRYANLTRADVLAANGRLREARQVLAEVREGAGADGDIVLLGVAQALAARWVLADDPAAAAREAQAALNAPWEDEGPRQFAQTWRVLVRGRIAQGELAAAQAALAGFEAWATRRDARSVDATLWLARAEVAAAGTATEDAAAAYAKALEAADASRIPAELLQVTSSYVPWLLAQGKAERAAAVAGRTAGFADRDFGAAVAAARLHRALGHSAAWQGALAQARRLAGERVLPADVLGPDA